ncbi:MAG: M28 family peptidase [Halobacteriaceae archaeon]
MVAWIGETFVSNTGWDHLENLVDIGNRMAGSKGEQEAAELARNQLQEYTEETSLITFDIQGWQRGSSQITTDNSTQSCIALPRSPSTTATAELIDLDYGLPDDFEETDVAGKIVMVDSFVPDWFDRYIHRREKYYHAVENDAAGFIYKNHVEGCLPPTGSVGTADQPIGEIPAVGVSKETGARLSRRFEDQEITVDVDATITDMKSQNVHAELGPETDEEIFITSHIDAHDIGEGAMDNGAGTAMVVELARALQSRSEELETKIHFIAFGAEEVGLVGSSFDADTREFDSIKAILNFDGVVRGRTLSFTTHDFDQLERVAEDVADDFGHPVETSPTMGPHSDHWPYVQSGVPGYHVMSKTGDQGRGWGHTEADTLDKVEKRNFREQAILLSELAIRLADDEFHIEHKHPEAIAEKLEEEDLAEGMKIIGDWPY